MKKDDLRVVKTERALRDAYKELIMKKSADEITVTAVTRQALVNRRTFYLHYGTTDDLERDVADEYADQTIERLLASGEGISGGILIYYEDMDGGDATFKRMMYGADTYIFFDEYTGRVLSSDFFRHFYENFPYPELTRGFLDSVTGIYMSWRQKSGRKPTLAELSERTAQMLMHGLSGQNKAG